MATKEKPDYAATARQIVDAVGGTDNITKVTHCVTRCRLVLKDPQVGHDAIDKVTAIPGVLQVVEAGGQYQVVIGPDVTKVYDEVCAITHKGEGEVGADPDQADGTPKDKGSFLGRMVTAMGSIFMPLMGAMIGCGLIGALATILMAAGLLPADSPTYALLSGISKCFIYFIPIMIGVQAGRYFGIDPWIGGAVGAAMLYPTVADPTLVGTTTTIFGFIPLSYMNYTQTVFPAMIAVWMTSYWYKFLKKRLPDSISFFMVPLLTLIVAIPLSLVVIGPIINTLSLGIAAAANSLYDLSPVVVGFVLGGIWGPILVPLDLHGAIAMGLYNNFIMQGYDYMLGLLCVFTPNIGILLAAYLKSRDKKNKEFLLSCFITNVMGTGEPGLYGFVMLHKQSMIVSAVAGAIGSAIAASFHTAYYALGTTGILSFPSYINPSGDMTSLVGWLVSNLVAFAIGFCCTYFSRFDVDEKQAA